METALTINLFINVTSAKTKTKMAGIISDLPETLLKIGGTGTTTPSDTKKRKTLPNFQNMYGSSKGKTSLQNSLGKSLTTHAPMLMNQRNVTCV